jgi:hypothetical protein
LESLRRWQELFPRLDALNESYPLQEAEAMNFGPDVCQLETIAAAAWVSVAGDPRRARDVAGRLTEHVSPSESQLARRKRLL